MCLPNSQESLAEQGRASVSGLCNATPSRDCGAPSRADLRSLGCSELLLSSLGSLCKHQGVPHTTSSAPLSGTSFVPTSQEAQKHLHPSTTTLPSSRDSSTDSCKTRSLGLKHKAQLEEHACGLSEAQRSRRGPLSLRYTYFSWICLDVPGQGRGDSSVIEMFVTKAREPAFCLQNPPMCRQGGRGRCALALLSIQFWPVRDPT